MRSGILVAALAIGSSGTVLAQTTPDTMPANSWLSVPNSRMRTVAPTNGQFAGTWGVQGPQAVITAWCGAALDTSRNRLVLWGGGHADYYGNELYAFNVGSLTWSRLTDPFINPVLDQEVNADGTPNSRHTYNGLAYIAHADRFFGLGGSLAGVGFADCHRTWVFDFAARKWTNRNPALTPGVSFGCNSSYDPTTKKVWWGGGANTPAAGMYSYDYDANTWTKHNSDSFYYYTSTVDTKRGLWVVVGNGKVFSYDLKNSNFTRQNWTTTGGDSFIGNANPGLDYDPIADKIVGWDGGGVYVLDPVTKVWSVNNPAGAPLATGLTAIGPGYKTGIYGRWRYVPSVNAFVLVTEFDDNVHFYKLTAGVGAAGTPPTLATPSSATPSTITGTTAALSVLGADGAGEATLTYTWSSTGPAAVTFSPNATNAAKNTTATFSAAGTYTLTATITNTSRASTSSSVSVTVAPTFCALDVFPASVGVAVSGTQAFLAIAEDQFGNSLAAQPALTWTASGGGTISASGLFTAGSAPGGPFTVRTESGAVSGTATVTVEEGSGVPAVGASGTRDHRRCGMGAIGAGVDLGFMGIASILALGLACKRSRLIAALD